MDAKNICIYVQYFTAFLALQMHLSFQTMTAIMFGGNNSDDQVH